MIQDELHLISGPLGTIAGLYETAIGELCKDEHGIGPKVVSSTATVRRAQDQIEQLFGSGASEIFPPLGPDRRDSFLARTVPASESPARVYLGIAAQGRSAKRVLVKTYQALMSAAYKLYLDCGGDANPDNPADPYMTLLGYFNSLRELGGTRRLVEDELTSRLKQYDRRRRVGEVDSPFVGRELVADVRELTSRFGTSEVARAKEDLSQPFGRGSKGVDIALATNMISVGLDISRLGLMAVFAQPKLTSEYIQSTSRVGRLKDKPGLVVTIFHAGRPRDRSHYERFASYHESFYRSVEATSVTPFSPRALDRALFAVTVALTRLKHDFMVTRVDASKILANRQDLNAVVETFVKRVEMSRNDKLGITPDQIRLRAKDLLDLWLGYAQELERQGIRLDYDLESGATSRQRNLLHEMLDPRLANLEREAYRQFKAPRSMRDVEPNVAILPRRYGQPRVPVKVYRQKTTASLLRQSQVVTTYGPGAMIDLPWFAAVVSGLDYWSKGTSIREERLQSTAADLLGLPGVELATPQHLDGFPNDTTQQGVVVWRFPEWALSQATRPGKDSDGRTYVSRLIIPPGQIDRERGTYRGAEFSRGGNVEDVQVVPIRFVRACKDSHMSDIDWPAYVHRGGPHCPRPLWLDDLGTTGELTELRVRCECGATRKISEAAGRDNPSLGRCNGDQRWLGPGAERVECDNMSRLLIRTASNAHFAQRLSVIALPDPGRTLEQLIERYWEDSLKDVPNEMILAYVLTRPPLKEPFSGYTPEEVFAGIQARREGANQARASIKEAEFNLLSCGRPMIGEDAYDADFHAEEIPGAAGPEFAHAVERVLQIHRLREVTALIGYTRFDYVTNNLDGEFDEEVKSAPLSANRTWLPAVENKGEGLFIQFRKEVIDAWREQPAVVEIERQFEAGLVQWNVENEANRKPFGPAYVMLHSLSHLLINAISLECGYPASSIKERIYARTEQGYGILLYTASIDSHGTLGGLASAAKDVGRYLQIAVEMAGLCSNDPVCSHHTPADANERRYLLGAACHSCLLISETSCELFNDFLDRRLVVETVESQGAEFFRAIAAPSPACSTTS